ncbi:MAG: hypothetical protein ACREU3_17375 [Steroidobacteraceae bacterium]
MRAKLRRVELDAGAPPLPTRHARQRVSASATERQAERELTERAEAAYRRLIVDWKATRPANKGAGATRGRAPSTPSKRQATRQATSPEPALQLVVTDAHHKLLHDPMQPARRI